jgi:hypothetical protein
MTTEELIAAGLPVDPVIEGAEHAAPTEDVGSPSTNREWLSPFVMAAPPGF